MVTVATVGEPSILRSSVLKRTSIFGLASTRAASDFWALNLSLRWIMRMPLARWERYMASSQAASPPPTTTIRLFLKKGPSQVAQ